MDTPATTSKSIKGERVAKSENKWRDEHEIGGKYQSRPIKSNSKLTLLQQNLKKNKLEYTRNMRVVGEEAVTAVTSSSAPSRDTVRSEQSTKYLYIGFRILGMNIPHRYKCPYIIYSLLLNGLVCIYLPMSFIISYTQMSSDDVHMSTLFTSLQVAINDYGCSAKIILLACMLPKLHAANAIMDQMDQRCTEPEEIVQIGKAVRNGGNLFIIFCIAYWSYSTSTFLGSMLNGRPPYDIYNPFLDWRKSKRQFLLSSLIEYALIDVACFQQVVNDAYPMIYVSILRTHFNVLLQRVEKLATDPTKSLDENLEDLKQCILDHKRLLQLYNTIAPVISLTIFVQFMITASILSVTLVNIMIFNTDFSSRVGSVFYLFAVVVEIFPLCYYSQCLMNDSNKLSDVIFHSNWVDQDIRYRKMLIFFMQRSQRIMELTAGKLFPITLSSFLSIAKFSFTLYTFIKEMGI